ncbi:MAG TPA: response regulator [Pyrinomonadaceae bacterium]|nr:response regulator [Pyrinomonadaceae bacterium]
MTKGHIGKVLIVDDEVELKNILLEALGSQGYEVCGFTSGEDAVAALRREAYDVMLTDLMMPGMNGIDLVKAGLEIDPHLVSIVMTGQGTIETAVEAMQNGAFDYILKPFRRPALMPLLTRAMNVRHMRLENLQLRETVAIFELAQTIALTLDPQTVISKLVDAVLQQTDADEVSVLLPVQEGGDELFVAAVRGKNREKLLGQRVTMKESVSGWVARERQPVILEGEIDDERFRSLYPHPEISSSISIPMLVANKVVGTININALHRLRPFTLAQLKVLTILAGTAAAALESASLYTQVRHAEENFRSIFENAVEGIFQTTLDRRFLRVNPSLARILGYDSAEEVVAAYTDVGQQLYVNPALAEEVTRILETSGTVENFEFEAYRKNREKIWLSLNIRLVRDEAGTPIFREGTLKDITGHKQAIEALRTSEERYRDLVENAHDIIYSHDLDGNYTSINKAGEQITGFSRDEVLHLSLQETVTPDDLSTANEMLRRKLAGERVTAYEMEIIAKDGRRVALEANTKLIFQDGIPIGVQGIARDVTDRKQLELQLRQSQKMEAIGQLAGGVAHDFNNLLTAINGYSSLALQRTNPDERIRGYLEEIRKAGDRAANLTRQLLAFGRKQMLKPVVLNLNDVVADIEKMLRRLIGEDIRFTTKLDPALHKVKTDPGQIEQVLMNLVVNARDAMPFGGTMTVETANFEVDHEYAARHVGIAPGKYVRLAVSDTGCGMDQETKARIFEPFFTTKEKGKGTGLGLSTVYGIVTQSGGNIWVYSEPEKGTVFKVYLPQLQQDAEAPQKVEAETTAPRGSETILLVEDEAVVRGLARQILEQAGYKVLDASGGDEAIRLCTEEMEPIDLLLTDVVMPETSGKEVAQRLTQLRPATRVLFMSGYTDEAIVHHGVLDSNVEFIQKPFTPVALARKVREVLDIKEDQTS